MSVQLNALSSPCVWCEKCSLFITMQWQYNQLSNNGNLAIYLSIHRHYRAKHSATALRFSKNPSGVVVEIIHFCSHALHFSTSYPLYFSHSSHTLALHGAISTLECHMPFSISFSWKNSNFMVRFNFFLQSSVFYFRAVRVQNALVAIFFGIYISF